jgi:phosphoglycolate phosphatase-like HAD superfamily hydrolase
MRKVEEFYASGIIHQARPVPGAREGVQALKDLGYRLIIVTARTKDVQDESWAWVDKHYPSVSIFAA